MKAVLYARVSTTQQAERDLSIPDQLRQLRSYCEQNDHAIVREFREDGASATDDHRPVFREMIEYVLGNDVEAILVLTTSRFFRDALGARVYKRRLKKAGVRVISITQEVADDPSGNFVEGIFELQDQYESEIIGYHSLRGMKENARRGFWNGAHPPFGYRTEPIEDERGNTKRRVVVDEAEAETVRLIFRLHESMGLRRLVEHLNSRGILRRGKPWSIDTLHQRIKDPIYVGDCYFNKREQRTAKRKPREEWIHMSVPPILSREVFERAKKLRDGRRPGAPDPTQTAAGNWLLTGIARCGKCGSRMSAETGYSRGRTYHYYNCATYLRKGKAECAGSRVGRKLLEDRVLQRIRDVILDPEVLRPLVMRLLAGWGTANEYRKKRLKPLRSSLDAAQGRLHRYFGLIERGAVDEALIADRLRELRSEESRLIAEINGIKATLDVALPAPSIDSVIEAGRWLQERLLSRGGADVRQCLQHILDHVDVAGHVVTVHCSPSMLTLVGFPLQSGGGTLCPDVGKNLVDTFTIAA